MTAPSARPSAQAGLHVRYEKAGLILDALPIPWNADAVIVEANVRLPKSAPTAKQDFTLRWSADGPSVSAELLVKATKAAPLRVFFRTPPPAQTAPASIFWKEHALGQIETPIITQAAYVAGFAIEMATMHVALGAHTVACQACVNTQAKSVLASAVLRSAGPLAPALDLGLRVDVDRSNGQRVGSVAVALTSEQMRARQALVTVMLPRLRWIDAYRVSWHLASRCLGAQPLRTIAKKTLQRSLRISATRFVLHKKDGALQTVRTLPTRDGRLLLDGVTEVAPCFYVSSGEPGMAGLVPFALRALESDVLKTLAIEKETLITNGPTPIVLGAVRAADLERIKHFTLASGDLVLGNLPLLPAPAAEFTAEGGFGSADDFLWSPAAQEQLDDRLGKLLDGT